MAKKKTAAITGVGAYLPDYILDNIELSQMVDTSDEWIMSRIGIKTRHILKGEGLGTSFMGEKAVLDLLEKTNTDPMDIEMVICATVTPDMFFPSTANLICYKTGIHIQRLEDGAIGRSSYFGRYRCVRALFA